MKRSAALASALAVVLIASVAYAAYYQSITLTGVIRLDIPAPTATPVPTATPAPVYTVDDWIQIARDARARSAAVDARLYVLEVDGRSYQNSAAGTQSAYGGINEVEKLVKDEAHRPWVAEARAQINDLHNTVSVAANSTLSQKSGAMGPWLIRPLVDGYNGAEDNYRWYNEATNAQKKQEYYEQLKASAIAAREMADQHEQLQAEMEEV
ncbi:MAG: hypothetical protein ACOYI5_05890, partial [Christensenellales bacterium]